MRLLGLQVGGFDDAGGLSIRFDAQRHSDPSMAFLVGPNGSGKSRALEAIGHIFAHLAAGVPPGIDFEIEYELGPRRVLVTTREPTVAALGPPAGNPEVGGWLLIATSPFDKWTAKHAHESWPPYLDDVLPSRVVGLSSGPASRLEWALRDSVASTLAQRVPERAEAPADPSGSEQGEHLRSEEAMIETELRGLAVAPRCLPIAGEEMAMPLLALLSHPAATGGADPIRDRVLTKADLDASGALRAFSFEIAADWRNRLLSQQHALFAEFIEQAAHRIAVAGFSGESDPSEHDLHAVFVLSEELEAWVEQCAARPFVWFDHLQGWLKAGALRSPKLLVTKRDRRGLLRDTDLSDGEFLAVGRYSLFLLLRENPGCLILFDEPETHFNDRWKIELMYELDEILADNSSQVVIATHSDLTLSDADRSDVFVFDMTYGEDVQVPHAPSISPFGADRSEITQQVFGADFAGGRRAIAIVDEAIESGDRSKLAEVLGRIGPGFQEFRLRYVTQKEEEDAG